MTKTGAKRFLLLLFAVYFGAVLFRFDFFPLSWVPMYGYIHKGEELHVVMGDKMARSVTGFVAQRANGEMINLTRRDLNIPPANFRRLYQQRAFNRAPPQHARERMNLMPINQWWYNTFVGPDPLLTENYAQDLLNSVNATFGYGPNDPQRIVRLEAKEKIATFTHAQMAAGDVSHPKTETVIAVVTPRRNMIVAADGKTLIKSVNNANFAE